MKIAIVRIRGGIRVDRDVLDTLEMLRLYRQNYCVILEKSPSVMGMVEKVKDYVTWGEIDDAAARAIAEKKGEKKFYRLNPPKGGFERKGIKKGFSQGGALGYRGEKIKDLIARMTG